MTCPGFGDMDRVQVIYLGIRLAHKIYRKPRHTIWLGVQCLDVVGDPACDIVIRRPFGLASSPDESGFFVVPGPVACE